MSDSYFSEDELRCKCGCGVSNFSDATLHKLNKLRKLFGKPINLSSAYRCPVYNRQIGATQTHASGQAVDILIGYRDAYKLMSLLYPLGFTGIGVKQKGKSRFIHIDDLPPGENRPRPHVWSY